MSKFYKLAKPKSKATSVAGKHFVDLAEAMDESYFEPPENPSESSTRRSTSAAAQPPWGEHPWEPTDEDLTWEFIWRVSSIASISNSRFYFRCFCNVDIKLFLFLDW